MDKHCTKKIIFSAFTAASILFVMSMSVYAWFFFPLTQNTSVYTDGVTEVSVEAYVYNGAAKSFGGAVEASGTPAVIPLRYYDNKGDINIPYFFLWGGEYTSNDQYQTIYKIVVTYGNEAEAYPTYLRLYGDFTFDFRCIGNDNEEIDIRFMKLSYFVPDAGNSGDYLDTSRYIPFGDEDYASGSTVILGTVGGSQTVHQIYTMTFYLLLETDMDALNSHADLIADEYGLLDAEYTINLSLYCRTLPANTYNP